MSKDPMKAREVRRRWDARHPSYGRDYRREHADSIRIAKRKYRESHQEQSRAYSRKYKSRHLEKEKERLRAVSQSVRQRALLRIARYWGDAFPRCRFDTLPEGHPLRKLPCYGALEIDHINGGGRQEALRNGRTATAQFVARGTRGVEDLRILCRLHQLWNVPTVPGVGRDGCHSGEGNSPSQRSIEVFRETEVGS